MNWAEEAFAPIEARYRAKVLTDTWGHLAPRKNAKYIGHIVWALGSYGSDHLNPTVLKCSLVSSSAGELDGGPWFFDAMVDFLAQQSEEEGTIWRFDGFFRNYEFVGTIRQVAL